MGDISIGAVGAALVAGLVSLLGLVISKEQKVSEFRQAWINDLRICLVTYLSELNSIIDLIALIKSGQVSDKTLLVSSYKSLNNASHGIRLRINSKEEISSELLAVMRRTEHLSGKNDDLTPQNIKELEGDFLHAAEKLLKYEWRRVKKGEAAFVWTKAIVISAIAALLLVALWSSFGHMIYQRKIDPNLPYACWVRL